MYNCRAGLCVTGFVNGKYSPSGEEEGENEELRLKAKKAYITALQKMVDSFKFSCLQTTFISAEENDICRTAQNVMRWVRANPITFRQVPMKNFAELKKYYLDEKMAIDQIHVETLKSKIESLKWSIGWRVEEISKIEIGTISDRWIPFAGTVSAAAMGMAIEAYQNQIYIERNELARLEAKLASLDEHTMKDKFKSARDQLKAIEEVMKS
jgi:hypothetical protein